MNVNAKTGYSSIGIHNGQRELYVPRNDGWIYIYDANTLEQIDRMDIGRSSSCVIYNEGLLFVSTDAWTQNPLKVYNRSTKKMIWETGDFDLTRFHLIPGTNSEFIEITLNIGPTDADYYNFDAHGTLIDHQDDRYHGDFPLDANIFAFFPDQEKFITSREGAVYGLDMQFQSRLPRGFLEFSSFSFSDDGRVIYAGCSNERSVQRYDAQDYARSGFYETKTYPEYIFTDGDELIIIGKASNSADSLLSIEKIEL